LLKWLQAPNLLGRRPELISALHKGSFGVDEKPVFLWPDCNARRFYPLATMRTSGHFREMVTTIAVRPDEESRFGDWRTPKGLPSDLPRRTASRSDAKGNYSWRA
jgi:hypothetical protein